MLEIIAIVICIGSVLTNYYLITKLEGIKFSVAEPQIVVQVIEKEKNSEVVEEVALKKDLPIKDESNYAWRNGKIETEPIKVGWRPANNPPPPPGPRERPSGFAR